MTAVLSSALFQDVDFTLAGATLTFDTPPIADARYTVHFTVDDLDDASDHHHSREVKTDWDGAEDTWTLTETPNEDEIRVFSVAAGGFLYYVVSDFHVTTNSKLYLAQINNDFTKTN